MSKCEHKHLVFEDGTLYVRCVDCPQYWAGVTHKGGMFDYTLMMSDPTIDTTRHSKYEPARDKPLK